MLSHEIYAVAFYLSSRRISKSHLRFRSRHVLRSVVDRLAKKLSFSMKNKERKGIYK